MPHRPPRPPIGLRRLAPAILLCLPACATDPATDAGPDTPADHERPAAAEPTNAALDAQRERRQRMGK